MSTSVILNLGKGNLQQGFASVSASLQAQNKNMQFTGSLPPAPELQSLYYRWQLLYELLYQARSINVRSHSTTRNLAEEEDGLIIDEADVTHVSEAEFWDVCQELQNSIDRWLDSDEFRPLERQLRKHLNPKDEIHTIIQAEDYQLKKLPWYVWQFFSDYPHAEVAIAPLDFESTPAVRQRLGQVRILAVLGDRRGIDVEADRVALNNLPHAEIVFLVEPQRQELDRQLWDERGWDLLFFAGHSCSSDEQSGRISIAPQESLTISQLKNALNRAIERGLQLAIFNSCEGLGLAAELADLQIPQTIVMREPVPNQVAEEFLKDFLRAFAAGQSLYLAVREARERLQGIEGRFPGASWLPVLFQNPARVPLTWQQLHDQTHSPVPLRRPKLSTVLCLSAIATLILIGVRWLGFLQSWELKAFDYFMVRIPAESADPRLLIIGADEEDLSSRYGYPLPDRTLARLLDKLKLYQPAAIGIDIFRDLPVPPGDAESHQALMIHLQRNEKLIAVCSGSSLKDSVAPPAAVPPSQVGFVDLFDDSTLTDGADIVRRYLLSRSSNPLEIPSRCDTPYSFAWQLVYSYLKQKNISVETVNRDWKFGSVIFRRLNQRSGGYQTLDARGNQMLLLYRNTPQIAQQITVRDILDETENFDSAWVKNRIVLIGYAAPSVKDIHDTPQGEIRGLSIHAHAISQILSAVEDNRSQIWWLPQWGEALWIGFWSLTGGVIVWYWQRPLQRGIAIGISLVILSGSCWLVFTQGGWLPFVPSALAVVVGLSFRYIFRA